MKSSHSRIIRNRSLDGVVFCSPSGDLETKAEAEQQERDQLKTLEDFWYHKGRQEGKSAGFDEGYQEGEAEGIRKGTEKGQAMGFDNGKAEGLEEGLASGRQEMTDVLHEQVQLLQTVSKSIRQEQGLLLELGKPEVIKFSLAVSEQLVRQELRDPESFKCVLEQLIDQVRLALDGACVHVWLSPLDHAMLADSLNAFEKDLTDLRVSIDKSLPQGDCRVEAPMGLVNFNISRQLEVLEKRVLEVHDAPSTPQQFQVDLATESEEVAEEPSAEQPS